MGKKYQDLRDRRRRKIHILNKYAIVPNRA